MTAPIRLLKPGEARAVIDRHTQAFNVAVDIRHILAEATGGHPDLIRSAVDQLEFEADLSPDQHLLRLDRDALAIFNNIWDNT